MMHNLLTATEEFNRKAGVPFGVLNPSSSIMGDRDLRRDLLREEVREYMHGENHDDLTEIVDGLIDIIVIAWEHWFIMSDPMWLNSALERCS